MNRFLLLALAASVGLSSCSKETTPPPPQQSATPAANSGTVIQAQNAGGYTYAEVDLGSGRKVWIAGGPIQVKPGDTVQWGPYAVMQNFTAKSLGRTFEQILFVNAWAPVGGAVGQVAPHGAMPGQLAAPAPAPAMVAADNQGQVKSVANAGGYTYLEVAQGAGTVWVAAPETNSVKAGDNVRWEGGAMMQNFTAKSLNRTFDKIVFAGGVTIVK